MAMMDSGLTCKTRAAAGGDTQRSSIATLPPAPLDAVRLLGQLQQPPEYGSLADVHLKPLADHGHVQPLDEFEWVVGGKVRDEWFGHWSVPNGRMVGCVSGI